MSSSIETLHAKLDTLTAQIARNIQRLPTIRNSNAAWLLSQHIENQQYEARQIAHDLNYAYYQERK